MKEKWKKIEENWMSQRRLNESTKVAGFSFFFFFFFLFHEVKIRSQNPAEIEDERNIDSMIDHEKISNLFQVKKEQGR